MSTSNSSGRQAATTRVKTAITQGVQMTAGQMLGTAGTTVLLASTIASPIIMTGALVVGVSAWFGSLCK